MRVYRFLLLSCIRGLEAAEHDEGDVSDLEMDGFSLIQLRSLLSVRQDQDKEWPVKLWGLSSIKKAASSAVKSTTKAAKSVAKAAGKAAVATAKVAVKCGVSSMGNAAAATACATKEAKTAAAKAVR